MIVNLEDINGKLIDIRTSYEYNLYHIKNSINIPKIKLLSDPSNFLNKNEKYFLICERGHESIIAAKILNALGYKVYSVDGGIKKNL